VRCAQAGVPEAAMAPRAKGEIALDELDRLKAAGVRFGMVLADAGCGASAAFRQGLDAQGLRWAVGILCNQKVYSVAVQPVPPQGGGRKPVPNEELAEAEKILTAQA
jgi:SRSO17 transposase